jgi:hypothetical protein
MPTTSSLARAKHDDGLDGDFIEEEWQFVPRRDDEDEDSERPLPNTHFDIDDDDLEDDADDTGDLSWDAGTEDDDDDDEDDNFDDWLEDSPNRDED